MPDEPRRLALVLCGARQEEFWNDAPPGTGGDKGGAQAFDFFDLKGLVEALLADLHVTNAKCRPIQAAALHPGRAAEFAIGDRAMGRFGELHPKVAETFNLAGRPVLVGEIDLEALHAALPFRHLYRPVPRFPAALRDVAVLVAESVAAEDVEREILLAGGKLLRGLRLFDLYRGDSIPAGTKSLAYALTYQADDRTLKDEEVKKAHDKIVGRLKHVLKAQIRDK